MTEQSLDFCVLGRIGYDLYAVEHNRPLPEVEHFSRHVGGSSANIAVGLSRLGLRVGIISCVGRDALADYLLTFLHSEGVNVQFVTQAAGYGTSLCLTEVSPPDHFPQVFYRHRPADGQIVVGEDEKAFIRRAKIFVTNGTSLAVSPSRESTLAALETAREGGLRTVFDMDYRESSWETAEEAGRTARKVLPWVDIVLGNAHEIAILTGEPDPDAQVEAVLSTGVAVLVRKLGAEGVEAHTRGQSFRAAPYPIKVVSTIGAGDGFASGFLYAFHRKIPLDNCLRYGNASAAIVVSRVSCSDAMPYRSELEEFLRTVGGQTAPEAPARE
ncbi:MAG TPA: 5-dehydro-2-deoxygluconokinase [Terriglobia bacterium]|nr:5-dehydro-2-deoxygluconokinase [Terriglobia bacterium]